MECTKGKPHEWRPRQPAPELKMVPKGRARKMLLGLQMRLQLLLKQIKEELRR